MFILIYFIFFSSFIYLSLSIFSPPILHLSFPFHPQSSSILICILYPSLSPLFLICISLTSFSHFCNYHHLSDFSFSFSSSLYTSLSFHLHITLHIPLYAFLTQSLHISLYSISMPPTSLLSLSPAFHLIQIYAIYNVPAT